MMIGFFDNDPPTLQDFQAFLKDAEKFYDDNREQAKITTILVVTHGRLDKKPLAFLLERAEERVVGLLEYKSLGTSRAREPLKSAGVASSVPPPAVMTSLLDYTAITKAVPSLVDKERVLYAWEVYPEKPLGDGQPVLAVTQERGVLMRRVGSDMVHDLSFKWEVSSEPEVEIDAGGPLLRIYDGSREQRLRNRDATFIQAFIHHLKWVRAGVVSGHMRELEFDKELTDRCAPDFEAGRYSDAVRNAYTLLETRIRKESLVPANVVGDQLAVEAFKPEGGRIPVGVSKPEQLGVQFLFQGAFLAFRNNVAHHQEISGLDRATTFQQLSLVNLLLEQVRRGKEQFHKGLH